MVLAGLGASLMGLGQWEPWWQQHQCDRSDAHSPVLLVGEAEQSTKQLCNPLEALWASV